MKLPVTKAQSPKVYILHENQEWITTLLTSLENRGIEYENWFLNEGKIDLGSTPPPGVFYNRMSASSHTRGHRFGPEFTAPVLAWLESHNRKVINGRRALQLELSKAEQYLALQQFGIKVPESLVAVGIEQTIKAAEFFKHKFILKPNRGGKGLGVKLFNSPTELKGYLDSVPLNDLTLDGSFIIQEYLPPVDGSITRMEFIAGTFYYAVKVDTGGSFELCPADECEQALDLNNIPCFSILEDFSIPETVQLEAFIAANNIQIAGIEFIETAGGERYFYDVNTNTNYNPAAEEKSNTGQRGMERIADYLEDELEKIISIKQPLEKVV